MNFEECINQCTTFIDLKRIASPYVIDYKKLSENELKQALIKTAPQYYHFENVQKTITALILNSIRNHRVVGDIFIDLLLNKDGFMELQKVIDEEILSYEQSIIDKANEFDDKLITSDPHMSLFKFVLDVAWEHNNDISVDEKNLIEKIRSKLNITNKEYQIIEAKLGKYPNENNVLHNKTDLGETRKYLQSVGLLFPIRDAKGNDYDIIPDEIASILRKIFGCEIKVYAYKQLLASKFVREKSYYINILEKSGCVVSQNLTIPQLQELLMKYVKPSNLLGGYTSKDGLDMSELTAWCSSLNLNIYGTKSEVISRILSYYDDIKQINVSSEDSREIYYGVFDELAKRNTAFLRKQLLIEKDLECEHKFEEATNFIFEKILKNKPLLLKGTDHPDGILSFKDKFIMWDNKSKETPVNLADHIKQFDRYIRTSEKPVAVFMVIGPDFTEDSIKECMKYTMESDTLILLITAKELKLVAENWNTKHKNDETAFPLGYFKQNGRFDKSIINY